MILCGELLSLGEKKNHRLVTLTTDRVTVVYEIRGIRFILLVCNNAAMKRCPVKVDLVRFLFLAFRCFCPLIGIITGKYELMARKRKKDDAQMTEISVSADGDFGETK